MAKDILGREIRAGDVIVVPYITHSPMLTMMIADVLRVTDNNVFWEAVNERGQVTHKRTLGKYVYLHTE